MGMNKTYKIKEVSVKVLDILEMISKGMDFDKILENKSDLTKQDIINAAKTAHDYILKKMIHDKMSELNDSFLKTLKSDILRYSDIHISNKWTPQNEAELRILYENGAKIKDLAKILKFPEEDIIMKIQILNLTRERNK